MQPVKRPVIHRGISKWEVDFGIVDGHRKRHLFDIEKGADGRIDQYNKDLKKAGDFWARMSSSERLSTTATLVEIKAAGKSPSEVWADWKRWKKETNSTAVEPTAYEDVLTEFKRRKKAAGKSERYIDETAQLLERFGQGRERQDIHEIPAGTLETWLAEQANERSWELSTKKTAQSVFSSLWRVAVDKGWASVNIADRLEPIKQPGRKVEIYSNESTINIMAAAMSNTLTKQVIAPLALGFFGCMRPEEIQSDKAIYEELPASLYFGWNDIDLDNGLVKVRTEIAKTGDERTIRLQPAAVQWLKLAKELKNPLPSVNERRLVDQYCELIALENWIRDGLRKNCATHLRVVYKNDYEVVKDMGNSVRILLKHYAGLHVPDEVSLEHWKITPKSVEKYMQTAKWKKVLKDAAEANEKKQKALEAEKVKASK
jgi:hypothetical protein